MGHWVYRIRRLEEDSEILRALWSAWYGQEYDLEHYPSIVRGVYHDLRREGARELKRILRHGRVQIQSIGGRPTRRRPEPDRGQRSTEFDYRPRGDGHEREVQGELFVPSRCDAFYWLEPTREDFGR